MLVRWTLASAACLGALGQVASRQVEEDNVQVRNVAIIGAGAAGSSAAYHLQQYAKEENLAINVTMFEKTNHVGGRTLTVNAFDNPLEPIELGASIFVTINHIMYNASREFGLDLGEKMTSSSNDAITAIWDGESFVFESSEGTSWWWDAGKMWWRYGLSPYYAVKLVKEVVSKFLQLYKEPYFPFESLTQRVYDLGLADITAITGEQLLAQNKINPAFSRHIIQAATRVNYASNLAYIHGLEAMVSFATDGAVSVNGGNWQIFDRMVQKSRAVLLRNTTVSSISFAKQGEDKSGLSSKYRISTQSSHDKKSASPAADEEFPTVFDDVIIASPWQFSHITAGEGIMEPQEIEEIPYTKLHVTLFASPYAMRPEFFKLKPGSKAPSNVYTTLGEGEKAGMGAKGVGRTGFYSISTLRTALNPKTQAQEYVYKIFSPDAVTPGFLSEILGVDVPSTFVPSKKKGEEGTDDDDGGDENKDSSSSRSVDAISWYYPHWFHSYPIELPRVTFQDPVLGKGLYYTSGIESFISTMETSALMGKNVARLVADAAAGIERDMTGLKDALGGEQVVMGEL